MKKNSYQIVGIVLVMAEPMITSVVVVVAVGIGVLVAVMVVGEYWWLSWWWESSGGADSGDGVSVCD